MVIETLWFTESTAAEEPKAVIPTVSPDTTVLPVGNGIYQETPATNCTLLAL